MPPDNTRWSWAVAIVLALAGWALTRLFETSTQGGEIYPAYSSLRSDPMGSKALHDSLASLSGYRVERMLRPKERFRPTAAQAVFVLDVFAASGPLLADCRRWTADGARVIVSLRASPSKENKEFEQDWKLRLEPARAGRRWTAFFPQDESWLVLHENQGQATVVEKRLGAGTVVLVGEGFLLSNEALGRARQTELLLALLGGRRSVVFEESHLGVVQSGSIGQLLRRYRLGGAALVLVILAGLFFWRASSSLLPEPAGPDAAAPPLHSGDEALVSLLRSAIPANALAPSALTLWNRAGGMLEGWSLSRRERVARALADGAAQPLDAWNHAHEILKRPSSSK